MPRLAFAAAVLLTALAVSVPAASARERGCGTILSGRARMTVTIEKGKVRCATARHVLRVYFLGGGKHHNGPTSAQSWVQIGRWRCASGTGGAGCIRGAKTFRHARDYIIGQH
jgi:hypothetical protein